MGEIIPLMSRKHYRTYKQNPDGDGGGSPSQPTPPRRSGNGFGWLKSALAIAGTAALTATVTYFVTETLARRRESKDKEATPALPGAGTAVPVPIPMWGPPMQYPQVLPPAPPPARSYDRPPTTAELLELARLRERREELENERIFLEGLG